ncbi:MAG: MFS transporter [Elusimicrobiota bacterium]|nr:MFS transporter [Elusimicrobiota bacterium]
MELTAAALPAEETPAVTRERAPLAGFVAGILSSQISNNAMHLVQPLVIADLSGSLGLAAFVAAAETGVHMLGTLVSGGSVDRLGSRRALMYATWGRGICLAFIPLAWAFGGLTLTWALCAYTLDAFVRGWVDSSVHALPLGLAEGDREELDRLNAAYEFTFDLASVIGPLLLGALLLTKQGFAAHAAIPVGFLLAGFLYSRVPEERVDAVQREKRARTKWLDWDGWRQIARDPRLLAPVAGLALFNLFPLRKVWSAFFAKAILGTPAAVGWIGAAFGLGGVIGALLFPRLRLSTRASVLFGAAGTAALAVSWAPGLLGPMLAGAALFGAANACAELSLLRALGELTPAGLFGRVTSVARVGTTSASVSLKAAMAGAFALGLTPYASFAVVGAGLGVMVLAQLTVAARLGRTER